MLLRVTDMDHTCNQAPLLSAVSRISLDEHSTSPVQGSPYNSYQSPCDSHEDISDLDNIRRNSCGAVNSEHDACYCKPSSLPKSLSLPLRQQTPDPFPELTSPVTPSSGHISMDSSSKSSPSSPMVRQRGHQTHNRKSTACLEESPNGKHIMWTPSVHTKIFVNIHNEDGGCHSLSIDEKAVASRVIETMVTKNHTVFNKNWVISEQLSKLHLERSMEDHECLSNVQKNWSNSDGNKFCFRKDFCKYEVFVNPNQFFPPSMIDVHIPDDSESLISRTDRYKSILLQNLFCADRMPDIQGYMQMKDGKRSWKKVFFVLRASGLYYSNKSTSKDPQHLVLFSHLNDVEIYNVINPKKTYSAPKNICICLKPSRIVTDSKELRLLCPEDEEARSCWVTGFRLIRYGNQLRENFQASLRAEERMHSVDSDDLSALKSSVNVKSRVAMDFTGRGGRVVDDPNEALGVAVEEAQHWRRKVSARLANSHSPLSGSPKCQGSFLSENPAVSRTGISSGLHMTQPWFHSGISREEAVRIIAKHGLVDGVFLVRDSLSIPNAFVLSMAHNHKVKHCQIRTIEVNGLTMVSLDGGHTKFTDLVQLVDFYQLNAAGLPCHLTYYVTRLP